METSSVAPTKNVTVLWRTFRGYHAQIVVLVLLGVIGAALDGIGINAFIPLISFYTNAANGPTDFITHAIQALFSFVHIPFEFKFLLAFIITLFILRAIAVTAFGYVRGMISAQFLGTESESILKQLLHGSWPFLLKQKIGTLQTTLVRDVQQSGNILLVLGQAIQSFSGFFIYLLIALNISVVMTACTLVAGVVLLLIVRPLMSRTQKMGNELTGVEKSYAQFLSEHVIGMKAVKAAGIENRAFASGGRLITRIRQLSIRRALIRSLSSSLFQPFSLIFVIVLFAVTYKLPSFSIVSFAAALYLIQKIFTYLESGQGALHTIRESIPYAQNLASLKSMLHEHRETEAGGESFRFERGIEFTDVSFAYGDTSVLSKVSFAIKRGETVGLIGPSGGGKTSIADLLLRLFEPTDGHLIIDGKPFSAIDLESWRQHVGYVAQDVFLLNATLEENIRFYRPELSREAVIKAAKQANIFDFIETLPNGFDTITGDRGVLLSGGQRQRVALARALAGSPELLILDEATSALDTASEELIQEAIHALHGSITVFIIAHRLSTVDRVDRILVLDAGTIREQGSPAELLAQKDSYFATHYTGRS